MAALSTIMTLVAYDTVVFDESSQLSTTDELNVSEAFDEIAYEIIGNLSDRASC